MRFTFLFIILCLALAAAPRAQAITVKAFDAKLFTFGHDAGTVSGDRAAGPQGPVLRDVIGRWLGSDRHVQTAFGATNAAWQGEDWLAILVAKRTRDTPPRFPDWFRISIAALGPDGYVEPPWPGSRGTPALAAVPLNSALPFLVASLVALGLVRTRHRRSSGATAVRTP